MVDQYWSTRLLHPHLPATKMASSTLSFDQTRYKEKSRKLVTLVNQLRDAGAQASFTVPTLVVCGNQSAGKSSLLERLCAVKLPRAAGTCTKCPAEVRSRPVDALLQVDSSLLGEGGLSSFQGHTTGHKASCCTMACKIAAAHSTSAPVTPQVRLSTASPGGDTTWRCQIKLRKEYGKDNRPLDNKPRETVFKTLNQVSWPTSVGTASRAHTHTDTPQPLCLRREHKVMIKLLNAQSLK